MQRESVKRKAGKVTLIVMPTKLPDQVNSSMTCSYRKQTKTTQYFSVLVGEGKTKGIGKSYKQQYTEKMFTCVLWRNFSKTTVENSIFRDDSGKGNKTKHQDKN